VILMMRQMQRLEPAQWDHQRDRQEDKSMVEGTVRRGVAMHNLMGEGGMERQRERQQRNEQKHWQTVTGGDEHDPEGVTDRN
jgi:hypothetical protein